MSSVPKLQVLVAHNDPLLTAGLEAMLVRDDDFIVSASASSLADMTSVDAHQPIDVILTDCKTGIRLARSSRLGRQAATCPRIVIVTQDESEVSIRRALEAGVRGYLLLGATRDSVVQAVRCAARGGIALDPIVATRMADSLKGDSITHREQDVLGLIMLGLPNKVIASRLGISVGTAKCHVKSLFAKLEANTRTEAAAIAQRRGLVIPQASSARERNSVDRYAHRSRLRDLSLTAEQSTRA
jgi:DNA-binding NarL/FixJ family response regulator